MSNLQSRALESEFCAIVSELGGDAEGKAAGDAFLAASHPVRGGRGVPDWAVTPKILGPAELGILREAAETFGRILEKVTARYLDDADFRALFRLPEELERQTLIPTGYDQLIPFMRLDTLFDQETGAFRFCGVATTSAGMTSAIDVTRAVRLTEAYRRFSERHEDIQTLDPVGGVVEALRETYASWANADAGSHHPERPVVGIVDYPESASAVEFADLIERLAEQGLFARFVDIRDLRIEEAGGQRRLVDSEGPVTCVYRRRVDDMTALPEEIEDALAEGCQILPLQAPDHIEANGTRVSMTGKSNVKTRLGVRLQGSTVPDVNNVSRGQGFLELNWIRNSQRPGVVMNGVEFKEEGAKHLGEFRIGMEGQMTENLHGFISGGIRAGGSGWHEETLNVGLKYTF